MVGATCYCIICIHVHVNSGMHQAYTLLKSSGSLSYSEIRVTICISACDPHCKRCQSTSAGPDKCDANQCDDYYTYESQTHTCKGKHTCFVCISEVLLCGYIAYVVGYNIKWICVLYFHIDLMIGGLAALSVGRRTCDHEISIEFDFRSGTVAQ